MTKVVGNPDHPLSRGMLCPRGAGATGLLYNPDRLRRPLLRREKRGEDVFEEVSWDAAFNRVGEGLLEVKRRHGPEAVALFTHGSGGSWFKHFMKAWGPLTILSPRELWPVYASPALAAGTVIGLVPAALATIVEVPRTSQPRDNAAVRQSCGRATDLPDI